MWHGHPARVVTCVTGVQPDSPAFGKNLLRLNPAEFRGNGTIVLPMTEKHGKVNKENRCAAILIMAHT
jgi:hypothetical protein